MSRFLAKYLLVTGGLTLLVMAFPWLIIIAAMALVIPGLILMIMPTLFLYGVIFAVFWYPLHRQLGEGQAAVIALAVAAGIGFVVPSVINRPTLAAIEAVQAQDKLPRAPLRLRGIVAVHRPSRVLKRDEMLVCDDLCGMLLFSEGVDAVAVGLSGRVDGEPPPRPVLYRLVPAESCPQPIVPKRLGSSSWAGWNAGEYEELERRWLLRLSAGECIIREGAQQREPDFIVREEIPELDRGLVPSNFSLAASAIRHRRFTISSRGSGEVLRQTEVEAWPVAKPLHVGTTGGINTFSFEWARDRWTDYRVVGKYEPIRLLRAHSELFSRSGSASDRKLVREHFAKALADPALPAPHAGLKLWEPFYKDIEEKGALPGDAGLMRQAISDARIKDYWFLWRSIAALGSDGVLLRDAMAQRVLSADFPKEREVGRAIGNLFGALPPGTFAEPTELEQRLLADPLRRRWAGGLIQRQSDRGAGAVLQLLQILEGWSARHHRERYAPTGEDEGDDAQAALRALCLLGRPAASALPRLEAMATADIIPAGYANDSNFHLVLVRLGKPVSQLTKPRSMTGTEENYRRYLAERARHADNCSF